MEKLFRFENGLRLAYVQNPFVRSVALGVFVGAGSAFENQNQNGISHFIEHMTFKGTKTRSAFDIVNEVDSIGAKINAFTTKHSTCYYTVSLGKNIGFCAEILSDLYFEATFSEDEIDRERKVVLEELSENEDTPDDVCLDNLAAVAFKGHPLSRTILGTKKTLENLSQKDLFAYKKDAYTADNTVVVVVGDVEFETAKELVEKHFANRFEKDECVLCSLAPASITSAGVKKTKRIEQAHISFAFPGVPFDGDGASALELLCMVFGLEMSSRLFQRVRERLGLCYTIYAYPSFYPKEGSLIIYTSTNPQSVEKAVRAIRSEIDLLLKDGITDAELDKGKEQMKTGLVLRQESTTAVMRAYGRNVQFLGELFDIDKKIAQIDALTLDDIIAVSKKVFDFQKVASSYVGAKTDLDILELIKQPSNGIEN
jgi:predicted Zn-dependent peptidase